MCVDEIRDARLLPAAQSPARHPLPGCELIVELDQLVRQQDTECFPIMRQPGPAFGFISQFGRQPPSSASKKNSRGRNSISAKWILSSSSGPSGSM